MPAPAIHQQPQEELNGIVGYACRVPGASRPEELWKLIVEQRDVRRKMPKDRFNVDGWFHPHGPNKGTTNAPYGYFLDQDLGLFDAGFFRISGKEAEAMDPQQRILLEVVYEALEDAGIRIQDIAGSNTSVYCGSFTNDYLKITDHDLASYPKYAVTGTGQSILANRISYFFDLHGESMTLDTACSSSLIALHLANQSVTTGQSDMAIVVGSALHYHPGMFVTMQDFGMLSPEGRSRSYDAGGKGYARGEGVCAVILKRVARAEHDGDRVRAVIRGTASNHDGTKSGITLPRSEAQEELIRRTYRQAGINTRDTRYFEGHGTGTAAGDPREARAIGSVFGFDDRTEPLFLGSVKSNIGHLEGAAGLASVIKTTLAIEKKQIPPNRHFECPNDKIDFGGWKLTVPTECYPWPENDSWRRASINSFGYGGANAHVIVEAYQRHSNTINGINGVHTNGIPKPPPLFVVPFSSHSETAGRKMFQRFAEYLRQNPDCNLGHLAHTLSTRRSLHELRTFLIADSPASLAVQLGEPSGESVGPSWVRERPSSQRIGFVFTGQGAQWASMGRSLIQLCPQFVGSLQRCDDILQQLPDRPEWSVVAELTKPNESSRLNQAEYSQPLCTAVQLALVDLLHDWGITPAACCGHSSGEMAAAYAAGILRFETALIYAYYRGRYTSKSRPEAYPVPGSMMAVGMSEAEATSTVERYSGRLRVAAINSPTSCTISGDEDAILELKAHLEQRKIFARQLVVSQAYHSHHMEPFSHVYQEAMEDCPLTSPASTPKAEMFSSVTARTARYKEMGPSYWVKNLVSPVRFSDAVTGILLDELDRPNVDILLEIGPHPALQGPTRQTMSALQRDVPYVGTLKRGQDDVEAMLTTMGRLFTLGVNIDFDRVNNNIHPKRLEELPSYAWDHSKYWAATRLTKEVMQRPHRHPLLGFPLPGWTGSSQRWRAILRTSELPWLTDHKIQGAPIFPAAGYISMVFDASLIACEGLEWSQICLREVKIISALAITDSDTGREVILELVRAATNNPRDPCFTFSIGSFNDDSTWVENCRGSVQVVAGKAATPMRQPSSEPLFDRIIPRERFYRGLHRAGLQYGDQFQLVDSDVESQPGHAMARLRFEDTSLDPRKCTLHPSWLDASLHPLFAAIEAQTDEPLESAFVPTSIETIRVSKACMEHITTGNTIKSMKTYASVSQLQSKFVVGDIRVQSLDDDVCVEMCGLTCTALGGVAHDVGRSLFSRTRWLPAFSTLGTHTKLSSPEFPEYLDLHTLLQWYVHEFPTSVISYVFGGASPSPAVLRVLGAEEGYRRRHSKLDVLSVAEAETNLSQTNCDLCVLEGSLTSNFTNAVAPGGYLISPHSTSDQWQSELVLRLQSPKWDIWRKQESTTPNGRVADTPLAIITDSSPSLRTKTCIDILRQRRRAVDIYEISDCKLQDVESLPKEIIVLASLDTPLLVPGSIGEDDQFENCQKLLCSPSRSGATSVFSETEPDQGILFGLLRTARSENELNRVVTLDVASSTTAQTLSDTAMYLLSDLTGEDEVARDNEALYISRIEMDDTLNSKLANGYGRLPHPEPFHQDERLSLKLQDWDYHSLPICEKFPGEELGENEVELRATTVGISLPGSTGVDVAGDVIKKGRLVTESAFRVSDRVLALDVSTGSLGNTIRIDQNRCVRLTGLEDSALMGGSDLCLAIYAVQYQAQIQRNDGVLIVGMERNVSLMIVRLCQRLGARVTVLASSSNDEKRVKHHLQAEDRFLVINDLAALDQLHRDGVRYNAIIQTYSSAALNVPDDLILPGSRSVSIDPLASLTPAKHIRACFIADLADIWRQDNSFRTSILETTMAIAEDGFLSVDGFDFTFAQIGSTMEINAKENTRLILRVPLELQVPVLPSRNSPQERLFKPDRTYLLAGGFSGLGVEIVQWMVRKGARNLVILSRSGATSEAAQKCLNWLQQHGVKATVFSGGVCDPNIVRNCVKSANPALAGVFQMAGVYRDASLQEMTVGQWKEPLQPKVVGTRNLSIATEGMDLDFFICFSSISAISGARGQANYNAANTYMDFLMRWRRERGLPGVTLNIGMVLGAGLLAKNSAIQEIMERTGSDGLSEVELLRHVEEGVRAGSSATIRDASGIDLYQIISGARVTDKDTFRSRKPLYKSLIADRDSESGSATNAEQGKTDIKVLLRSASDEARNEIVLDAFLTKLSTISGVPRETINPASSLAGYGLDSLVAVEIRNWFLRSVGVDIALFVILGAKSIRSLISEAVKGIQDEEERATDEPTDSTVAADAALSPIPVGNRPDHIPLSTYQGRFWFMHNVMEDRTHFNLRVILHLQGIPDVKILQAALEELKRHNEILRTAFIDGDEFTEQRVLSDCRVHLPYHDLSSRNDPSQELDNLTRELQRLELDLSHGESLRFSLAKVNERNFALVLIIHHIVIDRGSSEELLNQISTFYDDIALDRLSSRPRDHVQYADFTLYHNDKLQSASVRANMEFWKKELDSLPDPGPLLPFAKSNRDDVIEIQTFTHHATLEKEYLNRMKRIGASLNVTPFQFVMAAFRSFFYRFTDATDVAINIVDGGRPHPDVEKEIGAFINLVPVRIKHTFDGSFEEVLKVVRDKMLEVSEYPVPFDSLVREASSRTNVGTFPLSQLVINYQIHGKMAKYPTRDFVIDDYFTEDVPTASEINLEAIEDQENGLRIRFEHTTKLYDIPCMQRFLEGFVAFMRSVIKDHRQPIREVPIIGQSELDSLREQHWTISQTPISTKHYSLIEQILNIAKRQPTESALITSDGDTMTYGELIDASMSVSARLIAAGATPKSHISLLTWPGIQEIVAILGIIMCRCAYVPLDPDFAPDRISFIAEDSGSKIVMVGDGLSNLVNHSGEQLFPNKQIISIAEAITYQKKKVLHPTSLDDPLYVTYTSGSTGKPKGVVMRHYNAYPMFTVIENDYKFNSADRFLHQISMSWDLSAVQIFSPLLAGATMCIASAEARKDPLLLASFMKQAEVTFTYFTPTQFAVLLEADVETLRTCKQWRLAWFCGEAFPVRLAQAFYDLKVPARLFNTYGPCEAMVQVTMYEVSLPPNTATSVPIGRCLPTCQVYILDEGQNPLPLGLQGEIYIGGPQVGTGYLNRQEASAKGFPDDPFAVQLVEDKAYLGGKMFRTGDLGRLDQDGILHFVGRVAGDKMVKLRGLRIDLGEIEHNIFQFSRNEYNGFLTDVCVVARHIKDEVRGTASVADDRQLIAFLVSRRHDSASRLRFVQELSQSLTRTLNQYMIPTGFYFLEALPTSIGGKTNRQALLGQNLDGLLHSGQSLPVDEDSKHEQDRDLGTNFIEKVTDYFRELLQVPDTTELGLDSNFLELGGSSILLMRLQKKLLKELNVKVALGKLFSNPTPAAIASLLGDVTVKPISIQPTAQEHAKSSKVNKPNDQHVNDNARPINWHEEAQLPNDSRFHIPAPDSDDLFDAPDPTDIFMTGADSFMGIHFLAELLSRSQNMIYLVGTEKRLTKDHLLSEFRHFNLLTGSVNERVLTSRLNVLGGTMTQPHFGLSSSKFALLGSRVHTIFSLGVSVSLLKSYHDLHNVDIRPVRDLIELAACGDRVSNIVHLSTWSVPQLQSWSGTTRTPRIIRSEESAETYAPPASGEQGYIKARWVAEMLFHNAAKRGFPVKIFRGSAMTGSTKSGVPEYRDGIIQQTIMGMILTGTVPELDGFVADFVPVDHLASWLYSLSFNDLEQEHNDSDLPPAVKSPGATYYHVTNPSPLPLSRLVELIPQLRPTLVAAGARSLPLDRWLEKVESEASTGAGDDLRWAAMRDLFQSGHNMWALDTAATQSALRRAGERPEACPPVDAKYLKRLLENWTAAVNN
ncbi:putative Nonribosomal peptide synthetase [Aspergillus tanneri]|uniref:Putative Nonribosomal peptide synthetase n=1 Tax=Aspergillus tanneri TaxID=1220188 RepID=A0A5M9N3G2_9EURO|nr:putative Nonribosomal peptide synthetase [Aspergillus tanneri]KAA8652104.1 putative Nonribosomal peptide synthetase [Aspergillus tanneri]